MTTFSSEFIWLQ